jgi:4-hydroxybenzoate polyprenyltransferase
MNIKVFFVLCSVITLCYVLFFPPYWKYRITNGFNFFLSITYSLLMRELGLWKDLS